MIYLSWSVYKLTLVLIFIAIVRYALGKTKLIECKKYLNIATLCSVVLVLLMAINIGTKQEYLNRSKFNSNEVMVIEKIEVDVFNSDKVKKQFKENLGE